LSGQDGDEGGAAQSWGACGAASLPLGLDREGHISDYSGTDEIFRKHGNLVVGQHFPSPGKPTQIVEAGYLANGWIRVRHEDFDALRDILKKIGQMVQVRAA